MSTPDVTETNVDVGVMYKWAVHTLKSNVTKLSLRQLKTHYLDYIAPWKNFDSFVKSTSILEYAILDSCAKAWSLPHPEPTIGYHKYSYVSSPPSPRIHHRSLNPGIFSTCLWSNKKKNMLKSTMLITDESVHKNTGNKNSWLTGHLHTPLWERICLLHQVRGFLPLQH